MKWFTEYRVATRGFFINYVVTDQGLILSIINYNLFFILFYKIS